MLYYFIINNREDKKFILPAVQEQIAALDAPIKYETYLTTGLGDATRFVRMYCQFHPNEDVCFIACGGCGTLNEVASGIMGHERKHVAFLAFGTTNDFAKYYPDRDFTSLKDLLAGGLANIDIIKVNDDYSLNLINIGFDAMVSYNANLNVEEGKKNPYTKAIITSIFSNRFNLMKIYVDGIKLNSFSSLLCTIANNQWCGGNLHCAPQASNTDGKMDLIHVNSCSLLAFLFMFQHYKKGTYESSDFCRARMNIMKAKHIEISSRELIYVSMDGEISVAFKFVFDIIPGGLSIMLPKIKED